MQFRRWQWMVKTLSYFLTRQCPFKGLFFRRPSIGKTTVTKSCLNGVRHGVVGAIDLSVDMLGVVEGSSRQTRSNRSATGLAHMHKHKGGFPSMTSPLSNGIGKCHGRWIQTMVGLILPLPPLYAFYSAKKQEFPGGPQKEGERRQHRQVPHRAKQDVSFLHSSSCVLSCI